MSDETPQEKAADKIADIHWATDEAFLQAMNGPGVCVDAAASSRIVAARNELKSRIEQILQEN
jgi:hypothetical protein